MKKTRTELLRLAKIEFMEKVEPFAKRVQPFYSIMNWGWYDLDNPSQEIVPDQKRIVQHLISRTNKLLKDALEDTEEFLFLSSSGGINIVLVINEEEQYLKGEYQFIPVEDSFDFEEDF